MPMKSAASVLADESFSVATRQGTKAEYIITASVATLLIFTTIASYRFGGAVSAVAPAFMPVCASLWAFADLLTAFLLFSQFSVSGTRAFLLIGAAYALTGLMTIPYLARFPAVFIAAHTSITNEQFSVWLWLVWHFTFPGITGLCLLFDPGFNARFCGSCRRIAIRVAWASAISFCAAIVSIVTLMRHMLPQLVVNGHFLPVFSQITTGLAASIFCVLAIVFLRTPPRAALQYWLLIAILTTGLDAALNAFAPARYSISWYLGKVETLLTAGIVLIALVRELTTGYKRLSQMTMLDPLTGVRNRRGLAEVLQYTLDMGRRNSLATGMLVVDIDHFKLYNDKYGHAAGDVTLQWVAETLRKELTRSTDFVTRYGGEEFVVLLPATDAESAHGIAERLRTAIEDLGILHESSPAGSHLTVSIGVADTLGRLDLSGAALFDAADVALYEAKATGRNRVVIAAPLRPRPLSAAA
jgi:diguanylate cyclase (GGDEF)-like protein